MVGHDLEDASQTEIAVTTNAETETAAKTTVFPDQQVTSAPSETKLESVPNRTNDAIDNASNISGVNNTQDSFNPAAAPNDDDDTTEAGSTVLMSGQGGDDVLEKRSRSEKAKKRQKMEDDDSIRKASGKLKLKRKKEKDDPSKVRKKKREGKKLSSAQAAVEEMTRNILEEDKYSQKGSIVDTDSSDDDDDEYVIYASSGTTGGSKRGSVENEVSLIRLDRSVIARAARKRLYIEGMRGKMDASGGSGRKRHNSIIIVDDYGIQGDAIADNSKGDVSSQLNRNQEMKGQVINAEEAVPQEVEETSIFGQTTGSVNATWVECDKCKKWRRLRGVVDTKKLPPKWFCSMNKNDPDRAKCSAPEEEYDTVTPETISDQRARKHLRLWVRRIKCNEDYEAKMPTMTRGKRRTITSAKDPYEWIRCCNPSCGKWRVVLRSMDASSVIDACKTGEWYCVLNTWDEKTASCAAPQENLPAIGCPPWIMEDDE